MVANDNANFELMHNFDVKLIGFQLLKQPISLIVLNNEVRMTVLVSLKSSNNYEVRM